MPNEMCPIEARRGAGADVAAAPGLLPRRTMISPMSPILHWALAALVLPGRPAQERRVERDGLLVVRHLERDVIEPHGFPARGGERRRRRGLAAGGSLAAVLAAAVADLQIEAVGILHMEALEVAVVVGHRRQSALLQLGLHCFRVPRLDAPAESVERRHARRARTALAAAPGRTRTCGGRGGSRRRGRRDVSTANGEAAPVADVEHRQLAVVAANGPVHQRLVKGGFLRVVGGLAGQVVEQHGLPSRGRERQLRRGRVALRSAGLGAAALSLREGRCRPQGGCHPKRLQQLPA